jgi:CBS domain-containing protein
MLTVRDIMTADVITVAPDLSLRSALELFAARHIGGAPVMAGRRLVGVISMSDILSFQASMPPVPAARRELVEQGEVEPAGEWEEGAEAPADFFAGLWEDVGADVVERFAETGGPEWDLLAEHTVEEAMSRSLCTVAPDATIKYAAGFMVRAGIHRLLVVEGGQLVGLVSTWDLVKAVAAGRVS